MSLDSYRKKRNFSSTSEPARGGRRGGGIFVVQLHHASHRHYDFRLELDGALKSWAVPKGPSFDPAVKRLAVEVEDHPISYARFEGDIPKGNYGAGHVQVFDHGRWEPLGDARKGLQVGELKFILHGAILRGSWVLVRTRMQGSKQQWLLIKHADEFASKSEADDFVDSGNGRAQRERAAPAVGSGARTNPGTRRKMTALRGATQERLDHGFFEPELCEAADKPPSGESWLHEVKWDGYRILASILRGRIQLWSRNGIEWTGKLPELVEALANLELDDARLDGEIIVVNDGRDDFNALQARFSDASAAPVHYMLFDVVHAEGQSFASVPLIERKAWLADRLERHAHALLRYSDHQLGHGAAAFKQAIVGGLEGVVSKRIDSIYSGTRSGAWVKSKGRLSDEFIVAGFTEPKGSRSGIGALLLAKPSADGLRYVGRVGTGIGSDQLLDLRRKLDKSIVRKPSADAGLMAARDRPLAIWVKPQLVVEVFYQGIGGQGLLSQSAFKALRPDKKPADVLATTTAAAAQDRDTQAVVADPPAKSAARQPTKKKPAKSTESTMSKDSVTITHPQRIVFPGLKLSKQDVADYYRAVAEWILPGIAGRPLSVVRCPGGIGKACFFQKHVAKGVGDHVHGVTIREKDGEDRYLCIDDRQGLLELVQLNALEFHPWGARSDDPEHADRIVFDLDPHSSVTWDRVTVAARILCEQLASIHLQSFVRTSGGKGLHVVVPIQPDASWDEVRDFTQSVAVALAALEPNEFVSVAGEKNRKGKIFIDWLRNGRGATSVASYSLRARESVGVAMPLAWTDLKRIQSGDAIHAGNAIEWIKKRRKDPWAAMDEVIQKLPRF